MVLNYYGIDASRQDIDNSIRRVDNSIGATPEDELQYARDHGLEAEEYNNGTWDKVKSMIEPGLSCHGVRHRTEYPEIPSGNLPDGRHQIVITGYGNCRRRYAVCPVSRSQLRIGRRGEENLGRRFRESLGQ